MRSHAPRKGRSSAQRSACAAALVLLIAGTAPAQSLDLDGPAVQTVRGPWSDQVVRLLDDIPASEFAQDLHRIARLLIEHAEARPGEGAASMLLAHSIATGATALADDLASDRFDPLVRTMVMADIRSIVDNAPADLPGYERELRDALAPVSDAAFSGGAISSDPGAAGFGWFLDEPPSPVDAIVVRDRAEAARGALSDQAADRLVRLINACEAGRSHPAYHRSAVATLSDLARATELAHPPGWLGQGAIEFTRGLLAAVAMEPDAGRRADLLTIAAELSRLLRAVDELPDAPATTLAEETLSDRLASSQGDTLALAWLRLSRSMAEQAIQTPERPVPDEFIRSLRPAWVAARRDEQQARAAAHGLVPRVLATGASVSDPAVLAGVRAARDSGAAFERLIAFNTFATEGAGATSRPVAGKAWRDITDRAGDLVRSNPDALRELVSQAARFGELPGEADLRRARQDGSLAGWSPSLGRSATNLLSAIDDARARWRQAWSRADRTADAEEVAAELARLERLSRLVLADHRIARAEDDALAAWPGWPMSASARTLLATDLRIAVTTASEGLLDLGGDDDAGLADEEPDEQPDEDEILELAERVAAPALARVMLTERAARRLRGVQIGSSAAGETAQDNAASIAVRRTLGLIALGPPARGREWLADHRYELSGLAAATEQRVTATLDDHDDLADLYAGLAREHAEAIIAALWRE